NGPLGQVAGFAGTWDIHDNTFVGNWSYQGNIFGSWDGLIPVKQNFYRNIVWPANGGEGGNNGDMDVATLAVIGTIDYNLYPTTVLFCVGNATSRYTSLAAWQSATSAAGHSADAHSKQANPLFVGTGTDAAYYQLASGSTALTMSANGGQIGAWGNGATQVGSNFASSIAPATTPMAPTLLSVA